jgi:AcrR family transcriptional regulator
MSDSHSGYTQSVLSTASVIEVSMTESEAVRKPRPYHAPRRAEQAAATRAAIVDAASRLFAQRGYAGTTMAAIAAEARVAAKSVYLVAEKPQLLLLALDRAITGDDEPIPFADRPDTRAVLQATDSREQIEQAATLAAALLLRLYPLYRAFEQATAAEPELSHAWHDYQRRRRDDVTRVVDAVQRTSGLRPGLDRETAIDTVWALITWHPVALLVEERGWGTAELTDWLRDLLTTLLLPPGTA